MMASGNPSAQVNGTIASAKSYTRPWTATAFAALPGSHFWLGTGLAITVLGLFAVGRVIVDGASASSAGDLRLAIVHILFAAYAATAYAYLLAAATRCARDLAPAITPGTRSQAIVDQIGRHRWWSLALAGIAMNLVIAVITAQNTTVGINPWDWSVLSYDVHWHRVLGAFFGWWTGGFLYVLVVESARLSRLSEQIESLDLEDLHLYQPLIRLGLTNALLVIGMASVLSLFALEPGFAVMLIGAWTTFMIFAWIGLTLPLRDIRQKVRTVKNRELDWCRDALKNARDRLKSGEHGQPSIADIMAYKSTVDDIRNWPFDNPTLTRFALYLLIPLGSWLGGAFVERGLDLFLS
jgi:hypothetical protein